MNKQPFTFLHKPMADKLSLVRKCAAAALAAAAVAGAMVFPARAEMETLPSADAGRETAAFVETAETLPAPAQDAEETRRNRAARWRRAFLRVVKALLGGAATLAFGLLARAGSLLASGLSALFGGGLLAGLVGFLIEVLILFLLLLLLCCLLYKLLFPDRPLRAFFTRRNLLILLAASFALAGVRRLVRIKNPDLATAAALLRAFLFLLFLLFTLHSVFSRQGARRRILPNSSENVSEDKARVCTAGGKAKRPIQAFFPFLQKRV